MSDHGILMAPDTVRLERVLPGPMERVWAYLTDSEKRGKWLAKGEMDLRVGGRVQLHFRHADLTSHAEPVPEKYKGMESGHMMNGVITRIDPPRALSYTFGDSGEVTFELIPQGNEVLFVLTHRRLAENEQISIASGWHTHVGILVDCLHGRERGPFWSTHAKLEAEYKQRFAQSALQLTQTPVAKAEMLIRKPAAEVFEAFVNPEITTQFWFTKSSGRLEVGRQVRWDWEMYGVSALVTVKEIEPAKRIVIEWPYGGVQTKVEWVFTPHGNDATYVSVKNSGFQGEGDKVVSDALGSTGGFTWVLAGLKALLEHGIKLNLVADAFPHGK